MACYDPAALDVRQLELDASSCDDVFDRVADLFADDHDNVVVALRAREALGSTDVDDELAVPHASVDGLDHGVLVDIRLTHAVHWGEHEVKRCFCVVTPTGRKDEHTSLLAEAARRAHDPLE